MTTEAPPTAVAEVPPPPTEKEGKGSRSVPWLFMSPTLLLVVLFYAAPVVLIFVLSFTDMSSALGLRNWNFIGSANYEQILNHPNAVAIAWATVFYVGVTLGLFNVGLALVIALLSTHIPRRAGFLFRGIWLLPRITPPVVYILMWGYLAERVPYGVINEHILVPILGADGSGLVPQAAWTFVIVTNGLIGASFGMILFSSAIESIPRDYMNAALVDGCSLWQRVRYLILPSLKWPLLFVTTYQTLSLLTSFEYILLLTDGNFGTRVWSLWAYQVALSNYFGNFQFGLGAAMGVILVIIGVAAAIVLMKFFRFDELVQEPRIETL